MRSVLTSRFARYFAVLALLALGATAARTVVERYKMKHRTTGQMITVPGHIGPNAMLVSGWQTTPAGRQLPSGDMILSGQVSPDGKLFAFTNTGYTRHQLHIVDLATEKEIATFPMEQAWSGLAWAPDSKRIYVSSGAGYAGAAILVFDRWDKEGWHEVRGGLTLHGSSREALAVSSILVAADGKSLYAVNNSDGHVYIVDTHGGRGVGRVKTGDHPFSAALSKDGKTLYVTNLGSAEVAIVDVSSPGDPKVSGSIPTGHHPNDLALSADGTVLYVSCGNTNDVVALDLKANKRIETINVALGPKAPAGSTPNSLAMAPNGKTLYAANADNNTVAVIDVEERGKSKVEGFIPTGWYPTLVRVTADGKRVLIGSGKGVGTGPNKVKRPIDGVAPAVSFQHHGNNLNGLMSFVDTPDGRKLSAYTKQAYENSPYKDVLLESSETSADTVIPKRVGEKSPIEHVLYIMKENRTYDQVFGDLKQGNGDPSLTLFGWDVTPNQHTLAEQFVLLDNLYCSGEVSQDGQPWTLSAYATDFTQRAWTLSYSRHGRVDTRGVSEQSTPFIWELATSKGLKVRTYGMGNRRGTEPVRSVWWETREPGTNPGRARDYLRAERFIKEFEEMDKAGTVPNLIVMSLGENHTSGTAPGAYTPKAMVASNDVAVGKMVEAVTKSKVWSKSAIFIIEDDAQNGPDHVDSHRTTGLVISPYVKRKQVDSTMYSTVSMLRTIELLLGLPPMTQHDAAASPMVNSFMAKPDMSGFTALPARLDLMTKNPLHGYGAVESARMDFSEYDRIDMDALNRILWHSIKGENVPMPAPVRRALPTPQGLLQFRGDDGDGE